MDEGTVGTRERVEGWPGTIGEGLDEVAKGVMEDDAGVGGGLEEVGTSVVVRGNGGFVRAKDLCDVG